MFPLLLHLFCRSSFQLWCAPFGLAQALAAAAVQLLPICEPLRECHPQAPASTHQGTAAPVRVLPKELPAQVSTDSTYDYPSRHQAPTCPQAKDARLQWPYGPTRPCGQFISISSGHGCGPVSILKGSLGSKRAFKCCACALWQVFYGWVKPVPSFSWRRETLHIWCISLGAKLTMWHSLGSL